MACKTIPRTKFPFKLPKKIRIISTAQIASRANTGVWRSLITASVSPEDSTNRTNNRKPTKLHPKKAAQFSTENMLDIIFDRGNVSLLTPLYVIEKGLVDNSYLRIVRVGRSAQRDELVMRSFLSYDLFFSFLPSPVLYVGPTRNTYKLHSSMCVPRDSNFARLHNRHQNQIRFPFFFFKMRFHFSSSLIPLHELPSFVSNTTTNKLEPNSNSLSLTSVQNSDKSGLK